MRIAIDGRYIQDHFPGIGRYTFNLIRQLAEQSDDQFLVFHNPALTNSRYDIASLRAPNVSLVSVRVPTFSLREQYALSIAALRCRADLLHSPYYVKPYVAALPSVSTVYDAISAYYPQYLPSRRARWIFAVTMRLALASSRRVLTLSDSSRRDLVNLYGTSPDKLVVTYLAADPAYQPIDRGRCLTVRDRYDLPERFVLYLGINKPHKNLVMLIEALALARGSADVHFVIAGAQDARRPEAPEAVERLGLSHVVRFIPNVPETELPCLYNLAESFAFPSLYEGFGLPPLEAMACGRPVICSNSSSLPEVIGDGGVMLDPNDRRAWAEAMVDLWQSESRRDELSRRALERASYFSWAKTARRTLQAYREALAA